MEKTRVQKLVALAKAIINARRNGLYRQTNNLKMDKRILWAIFGLLVAALIVMAIMFRYEPLTLNGSNGRPMEVWDRWSHRICFVMPGSPKVMCTADELKNAGAE